MAKHRASRALFVVALLVALIGCSSPTQTTAPYDQPVILRLSVDTVTPGSWVTIYGRNLAFCHPWLGDSSMYSEDTVSFDHTYGMVPYGMPPGSYHVYVSSGSFRVASPKPLVVQNQPKLSYFSLYGISRDPFFPGSRVALYGSHILEKKDSITVLFKNQFLPIDSVYDDSIIVHLPVNATSGALQVIYHDSVILGYSLTVFRPFAWRHCTMRLIGFQGRATHRRVGLVDGLKRSIDSVWTDTVTMDRVDTFSLHPYYTYCQNSTFSLSEAANVEGDLHRAIRLGLSWDTLLHSLSATWTYTSSYSSILPIQFTADSTMTMFGTLSNKPLDMDGATSFLLPISSMVSKDFRSTRTESDHLGDHSWTETVYIAPSDVGRLEIEFTP